MAQCDCYMSQSQDCVLGHQLSVLRFVLGVQPVRHREDEGLHNVLLMGPHARPERLAKIFNGRVPEFLESDQGGVWLLRLLHLGCHILVAVGNFKKALLFCCRYKLKKSKIDAQKQRKEVFYAILYQSAGQCVSALREIHQRDLRLPPEKDKHNWWIFKCRSVSQIQQ